ncbi:Mitochondrial carrier protein CoAc1 [Hondaea fermentalgiana]|uniref:Mitochondrial carrier protein CoAc1 n=1 Tax=Hondaea fermentalgiana TaxID=2315210 RepID=A0A2R5GQ47_9STRA|nr:Mitochondrial carrier protein CoAc1 [Hondaea fermentalgiana]|eukprot:GBG30743.1 Mitochondrial carrier protein CoAc1 [Hondaea fermentalgiana]
MVQLKRPDHEAAQNAVHVEKKLRDLFNALDKNGDGQVRLEVAIRLIRSILGTDELDEEALRRLCPKQMCAQKIRYGDFRELIQVAGAWVVLRDVDRTHFERRWTSITDPENNYTIDFPLRRRGSTAPGSGDPLLDANNLQDDPEYSRAMFSDRVQRLRLVEPDIRSHISKRILAHVDEARPLAEELKRHITSHNHTPGEGADPRSSSITPSRPDETSPSISSASSTAQAAAYRQQMQSLAQLPSRPDSERMSQAAETAAKEIKSEVSDAIEASKPFAESALDVVKSLGAGAIAGATAKTVIAPLDRTKIIFQTTDRKFSVRAAALEMSRIVREDGVRGLWRGHSATLSRVAPYAALQFVSFDTFKGLLLREEDTHLTPVRRLLAGSLAGATSVCATYPLDLLRARMAVQSKAHGGMRHNFRVILQNEGVSGMYRGLGPTLFGIVPYAGLAFGTFETLKIMVSQHYGSETVTAGQRLVCGALAGFIAQSLTYPLDIVRRRMQTDGMQQIKNPGVPTQRQYHSILQTLHKVARTEGVVGGLFKGLSMNWVKGPISHGISFTTFDIMKRHFDVQPARK